MTAEQVRLEEARQLKVPWKTWAVSERTPMGTVREDYSADGNAWEYCSHDQARSRAYRWREDGPAGVSVQVLRHLQTDQRSAGATRSGEGASREGPLKTEKRPRPPRWQS